MKNKKFKVVVPYYIEFTVSAENEEEARKVAGRLTVSEGVVIGRDGNDAEAEEIKE